MIYTFERTQQLPISIQEAWAFFSSPKNLQKITPDYMGFDILTKDLADKMHEGMKIEYRVRPVLNIPLHWVTEIIGVNEPYFFVDEQRKGPYKQWHHEHSFQSIEGGVKMIDKVDYELPFGFLGSIAHAVFVKRQLTGIFDYRYKLLSDKFGTLN